jgi:hypothetical protein
MILPATLGPVPEPEAAPPSIKDALLMLADRPRLAAMLCRRMQAVPRPQREAQFPNIIRAIAETL